MKRHSTHLFDEKFSGNAGRYVAQCALVVLVMVVVLWVLNAITDAAIIGALGASSFIAFTMPQAQVSRPRFLVGGYAIGVITGYICYYAAVAAAHVPVPMLQESPEVVFGALAVGLSIFLMVITDFEHPPAASLALGLVLNECNPHSVVVVIVGIVLLAGIKALFKPMLIDLL